MYKYPTFISLSLQMYNKVVYSLIERDDFMEKSDLRIIKTKKSGGKAFVKGVNVLDSNPGAYKHVKKRYKMA